MEIYNCLNLSPAGFDCPQPAQELIGSGNVGNATAGTNSFTSKGVGINVTPTTNTAPGAGLWSIYDDTTGALVDAPDNTVWKVVTDLSVAPATDLEGVTREASGFNPGAYERTAAEVGTPLGGDGEDYLRDAYIRGRLLRGSAIREPFIRNVKS